MSPIMITITWGTSHPGWPPKKADRKFPVYWKTKEKLRKQIKPKEKPKNVGYKVDALVLWLTRQP